MFNKSLTLQLYGNTFVISAKFCNLKYPVLRDMYGKHMATYSEIQNGTYFFKAECNIII